ncbi:SCF-associated factor 1 [Spathaspora sp. JA1]|nr:SCF-associated factor 1 [Spathaspora sp. JA1]
MTLSILDLGDDILTSQIPQYLFPKDIFNFSLLNHYLYDLYHFSNLSTIIYQTLYNKKFTNNENNYTISLKNKLNWKQLFQLRCSQDQKVFTWGEPQNGRLGYLTSRIEHSHVALGGWAVHTPSNIAQFNNHLIIDIVANGFSFIILTNSGELWFTGIDWKNPVVNVSTPGPIEARDYRPLPGELALDTLHQQSGSTVGSRRSILGVLPIPFMNRRYQDDEEDVTSTSPTPPPGPTNTGLPQARRRLQPQPIETGAHPDFNHSPSRIEETNFLTRLHLPPNQQPDRKIISISTGREHIIALDNYNNIYSWDTGCSTNMGVQIIFSDIDLTRLMVKKIVAGWNLSACEISGYGLIVWYSRTEITKEQYQQHDFTSRAKYLVIPFTKDDIVDFTVGSDYILYIRKSDEKLYQFRFNAHELARRSSAIDNDELLSWISPMNNFNNWKSSVASEGVENVRFTKLNSCFTNFVVFTNHDQVLIGTSKHLLYNSQEEQEEEEETGATPKVIPELQGQNIKTLVIGDYHYMALTNEGNILSWGRESSTCGCLGLGMFNTVAEENPNSARLESGALVVYKPLVVKNPPYPGKWVTITASGWQSGGIYVPC